ncbi:MAG: hypothetical protein ACI9DC_001185 [Gammaproteobacteria bacterium]|jgi:hypothetical protein
MIFSLNEIETMAKRAARGAGLDWGLAEESAKAVRWLAERDLPGAQSRAQLLIHNDGRTYRELAPALTDGTWHARCGQLCLIACGAALSDRAQSIADGGAVDLGPIRQPLLLLPFAACAARETNSAIELSWHDLSMTVVADGVVAEGSQCALTVEVARGVCCRATHSVVIAASARTCGRAVDAESWRRLDAFSRRTFAPASEASRASGAEPGLEDND